MYPTVEATFRGDVRTIKMFCKLAQPAHVPSLEEVEKQFMTEFDYVEEAKQMQQIRENLINAGFASEDKDDFSTISYVPIPYLDLCTKRVLVMEELDGEKLVDGLVKDIDTLASLSGKTTEEFLAHEEQLNQKARKEGVLREGPSASEFDSYIKLLDSKRRVSNAVAKLNNLLIGWLPNSKSKPYVGKQELPVNQAEIIDDLLLIFAHQILVDGYFNGDPHSGNIILMKNTNKDKRRISNPYKLGLIDYGQVKKLTDKDRHLFCRLIIALAEDNRKEICRLAKEAGHLTKFGDEDLSYKFQKVSYDSLDPKILNGDHIQVFIENLEKVDPIEQLAKELIMIQRVSVMIRGLGHYLNQNRSAAKLWKPIAEEVLRNESEK